MAGLQWMKEKSKRMDFSTMLYVFRLSVLQKLLQTSPDAIKRGRHTLHCIFSHGSYTGRDSPRSHPGREVAPLVSHDLPFYPNKAIPLPSLLPCLVHVLQSPEHDCVELSTRGNCCWLMFSGRRALLLLKFPDPSNSCY